MLVDYLSLSVSLAMVGSQQLQLDSKNLAEFTPKIRDKLRSAIRHNGGQHSLVSVYMFHK